MTFHQVREFNTAFQVYLSPHPTLPGLSEGLKNELYKTTLHVKELARYMHSVCAAYNNSPTAMRAHLMLEEMSEVLEAMYKDDMVNLLKEFCDQRIVNDGSIQVFGFEPVFMEAFHRVHASNMSKLVDGKPLKNAVGRIQKGPNYIKPDLSDLITTGEEVK